MRPASLFTNKTYIAISIAYTYVDENGDLASYLF